MTPAQGRRGFLRSACRHCLGLGGLVSAAAMAQPTDKLIPARFSRPALDTDEGGLWALMDREETRLRRSSFAIRDEALHKYVRDLVCRLGGEHCADVRVHLVRSPQFNATMAPNGMMTVYSGLLLRVENEAQLAAVLGHELGHYFERHLVETLRDRKSRAAAATVLAMFGLVGGLASLGVLASHFGFSRDQEARADQVGMRLIQAAGYDGRQAALIWDNLLGELKITGGEEAGKRSPMFATHPPVESRRDDLMKLAGDGGGRLGVAEFDHAVAPHRFEWLEEEIRRGQFEESLVLFNRLLKRRPGDAQVLFARGEVRRLRDKPEDLSQALQDLQAATSEAESPVLAWRSLGLAHRRRSDAAAAAEAFQKYLALVPEAGDASVIQSYLTEVKP
ncbi:M48 family metalloprotease [Caenimonas sedimenti]|uniref:M48 family metalloprotease n=1 Tax=Caenimonas sedimenti TaxID=2596921 RepID=A0A562ZTX8_9BURK|nr:M48 family metallopeptidase [Caenimonas sedimenti]TWO71943.1 M48 family metalloprotease [Caenimonas sedimenti]